MNVDKDIDLILGRMEYGKNYDYPAQLWYDRLGKLVYDTNDKPKIKLTLDTMLANDLVERRPDSDYKGTYFISLTVNGQSVKDSGGWVKHLTKLNKHKSVFRFENWVKVVALLEGLAIIICTPIAIALQTKSNELEKDNKAVKKQAESLMRQIQSTKDSLKSLNSTKVKK